MSIDQAVAAPVCTRRFAEAGARVIKIEREGGDFARQYDCVAGGDSSCFLWTNLDKEPVVANFKDPEDADLLHRILSRADILVQNLGLGAFKRAARRGAMPRISACPE